MQGYNEYCNDVYKASLTQTRVDGIGIPDKILGKLDRKQINNWRNFSKHATKTLGVA